MANKKIIYQGAGGLSLVAGLDWQLLPASKKIDDSVREKARIKSATHFVTCSAQESEEITIGKKTSHVHRVTAGLVQSLGGSKDFDKKSHSAAAAFVEWTKDSPKSALYALVDDERVVVVVSINGMPILDSIVNDRNEARMRLAEFLNTHPDMQVFANDPDQYPQDYYDELWPSIASAASKSTAIKSVPVNYVMVVSVVAALAVAYGGWHFWQVEHARQKRIELEREAAANSPENLYMQALAAVQSWGVERDSMLKAFDSIMPLPYTVSGWKGVEVGCDQSCRMKFERTHGTFEMFSQSTSHLPLKVLPNPSEITLERISTIWEQEIKPAALPESSKTATLETFISKDGSQFQDWMLVGFSLRIDAPEIFPQAPGVPPNFSHPQAVRRGAFEVDGVALPLVREVISTAPSNVVFTGFKVALSADGQNDLAKAITNITGFFYVNQ